MIGVRGFVAALTVLGAFSIRLDAQVVLNPNPSRAVGQLSVQRASAPNLVEGRELNSPIGVAVDGARRIVWVVDLGNNRVLGWRNAATFANGARADYVLGQRDLTSTDSQGPGTGFSTGLSAPTAVAVDATGNVYVADSGNNRVIRYPKPFDQPEELKLADMVIGQTSFNGRNPNFAGSVNERGLALATQGVVFRSGVIFDPQGNLWVSDSGNNRVLRYPASALGDNAASGPSANLVLGQADLGGNAPLNAPNFNEAKIRKNGMREPAGLAFDQGGRLYVADRFNRVLVYRPPFASGAEAARIMGVVPAPPQGQPPPAPVNEYSIGVVTQAGQVESADAVFAIGNTIFVVDRPANRIVRYDPFDQWPPESASFSPQGRAFIGQDSATQTEPRLNRGLPEPNPSSFAQPSHAVFVNGETYIADSLNHRVLIMGDISTGPTLAAGAPYVARRVLGQDTFEGRSVNLIEGREFNFAVGNSSEGTGLVVDTRSSPPRLYVADPLNHRVLCFADARRVRGGDAADIVIGQPDFQRAIVNFPENDVNSRNQRSLALPLAVATDRDSNLWVADSVNGRVLRFPNPFAKPGGPHDADLVLGQSNFAVRLSDATARTMSAPAGLAFSVEGSLLVSDNALNRVLRFDPPFSNGMAAARVFGQPDFTTSATGTTENRLNRPRGISVDTDNRLYVADTNNNRIQIFSNVRVGGNNPTAGFSLSNGISRPLSVFVSPQSGDIWVSNSGAGRAQRYPNFDRLIAAGDQPDLQIPAAGPLAITQDAFGNLYMADLRNRIAIHFPVVEVVNAANYLPRVTPGMWAAVRSNRFNYTFTEQTAITQAVPHPKELGDLRILMNGIPASLFFVSPFQINFTVPWSLPSSGTAEVVVEQISTGRIISATEISMDVASPGLFTANATGTGQVAAINLQDNTINGVGQGLNTVARGQLLTLYGTGQGPIGGAPADGSPAQGVVSTDVKPIVIVGGQRLTDDEILYSGLAPGLIGVWQINIRIPDRVPPNTQTLVVVVFRDVPSNNPQQPAQIRTTIAVR